MRDTCLWATRRAVPAWLAATHSRKLAALSQEHHGLRLLCRAYRDDAVLVVLKWTL